MRLIETFKCATGAGWGILVDGDMDTEIVYHENEGAVAMTASCKYPGETIVTTSNPKHYSNRQCAPQFSTTSACGPLASRKTRRSN